MVLVFESETEYPWRTKFLTRVKVILALFAPFTCLGTPIAVLPFKIIILSRVMYTIKELLRKDAFLKYEIVVAPNTVYLEDWDGQGM